MYTVVFSLFKSTSLLPRSLPPKPPPDPPPKLDATRLIVAAPPHLALFSLRSVEPALGRDQTGFAAVAVPRDKGQGEDGGAGEQGRMDGRTDGEFWTRLGRRT